MAASVAHCELCGNVLNDAHPQSSCDYCHRILCRDCVYSDVADHHCQTCRECLRAMTPYGNLSSESSDDLIRMLMDPRATDPYNAAVVLGLQKERKAVPALIRGLATGNALLRSRCAEALGKIDDPHAIGPLIQTLINDSEETPRYRAAEALGVMNAVVALKPLRQALNDPSAMVKGYAAKAIGALGDAESLPLLYKLIISEDAGWASRDAISVVAQLGGRNAEDCLVKALRHERWDVRAAAAKTLGGIGSDACTGALEHVMNEDEKEEVREKAARALGSLRHIDSSKLLAFRLCKSPSRIEKQGCAYGLKDMGWTPTTIEEQVKFLLFTGQFEAASKLGPDAVDVLSEMMFDDDTHVQWMATSTLRSLQRRQTR